MHNYTGFSKIASKGFLPTSEKIFKKLSAFDMMQIKTIVIKFHYSVWLLVSVLAFLFSCKQEKSTKEFQNDKGQLIVQEWYSVENLKSETTYLKSDKSDYIYVAYNQNGWMIDSGRYVNDTITGFHEFYEDKTRLRHFEHYENGLLNGTHKAIYSGGITSFEGYRKDGYLVGEWEFHYPDGRMITYEYYDSTGRILYFRKYDDEGNATKITGNGIIGIYISQSSDNTYRGIVEVAIPDNCKTNLKIIQKENGRENTIFEKEVFQVNIPFSFNKTDNTILNFQLNITEKKTGKEETYSSEKNF